MRVASLAPSMMLERDCAKVEEAQYYNHNYLPPHAFIISPEAG